MNPYTIAAKVAPKIPEARIWLPDLVLTGQVVKLIVGQLIKCLPDSELLHAFAQSVAVNSQGRGESGQLDIAVSCSGFLQILGVDVLLRTTRTSCLWLNYRL